MAVIRASDNTIINYLMYVNRNDQIWLGLGPVSLLAYAGQTIKLEFGVANDIDALKTSAYFDDVNLYMCTPDPVAQTCTSTGYLLNQDFETNTGWTIKPSVRPSLYSTEFFTSGTWSMLSGLPVWQANTLPGTGTWSEFYQAFTIPANATFAQLSYSLLPRSNYWAGWAAALRDAPVEEDTGHSTLLPRHVISNTAT